jgi:predicted dehydrogenase
MSHLWDSVNMIVGMGIPEACMTHGALYFWKDELAVPDMWHAIFDYPQRQLTVTFNQAFHNSHYGDVVQVLGRDGTMEAGSNFCRTWGAEWKPDYQKKMREARQKVGRDGAIPPDYSFKTGEIEVSSHWQDFIDCMKTRATPRCGVDRAFEEAVAVFMSVEAHKRERKVRWDTASEEIVNV